MIDREIKDPIVKEVIEQFIDRSEVGIKKYGTTLSDNNTDDYLLHLQQELMDAVLYIHKKRSQYKDNKEKLNKMYPGIFESNKPI